MKLALFLFALILATALASQETEPGKTYPSGTPQQTDPWAGTWEINVAQSKLQGPAPKGETIRIEVADANAVKYTVTGTGADGKPFTSTYDGRPDAAAPLMQDGQEVGRITYHRVSSRKTVADAQMADGSSVTQEITLSADGKSFTVTEHVNSTQGEYDQIVVFTRLASR